jgi:hypothetical protein
MRYTTPGLTPSDAHLRRLDEASALARGLACAASARPGCREIVSGGVAGRIHGPGAPVA